MMSKEFKRFRRESGMARFERECRLATECGRCKKAYRIPGTPEAGKHAMYYYMYENQQQRAKGV